MYFLLLSRKLRDIRRPSCNVLFSSEIKHIRIWWIYFINNPQHKKARKPAHCVSSCSVKTHTDTQTHRHGKANCPASQIFSKDAERSQIGFTRKRLSAQQLGKSEGNPCLAKRLITFITVLMRLTQNISNAYRQNRLVRTGIKGTLLKLQTEFSVNSYATAVTAILQFLRCFASSLPV